MDNRLKVLLGLVGVVLMFSLTVLGFAAMNKRGYEGRVEDIRAEGLPVTFEELGAWYPPAIEGENGAGIYLSAFSMLKRDQADFIGNDLPLIGAELESTGALQSDVSAAIKKFVAEHRDSLTLLHEAAEVGRSRYELDLAHALDSYMELVSPARSGVLLLCLEAVAKGEAGDRPGAIDSLLSAVNLTESINTFPTYFSRLVYLGRFESITDTVARLLNVSMEQTSGLTELLSALRKANDTRALYRANVGERCFITATNSNEGKAELLLLENLGLDESPYLSRLRWYTRIGLRAADYGYQVDAYSEKIAAAELPLPERLDALTELEEGAKRPPKYRYFGRLEFDLETEMLEGFHLTDTAHLARVRLAIQAIQLRRYEKRNGGFPETLRELGSADASLLDPFDGQPLRYETVNGGCRLYSIGQNRQDDGGSEALSAGNRFPQDIVVRLIDSAS